MDLKRQFEEENKNYAEYRVNDSLVESFWYYKAYSKWLEERIVKLFAIPDVSNKEVAVCECNKPNTQADREHGLKLCRNCKKRDSQTVC